MHSEKNKSTSILLIWVVGYLTLNFAPLYVLGLIQGFPLNIFFINNHHIELKTLNQLTAFSILLMSIIYLMVFHGRMPRSKEFYYTNSRIQGLFLLCISLGLLLLLPDYAQLSKLHLLILKLVHFIGISIFALNPSPKNFIVFLLICMLIGMSGVRGPLISCLFFFTLHRWSDHKLQLSKIISKKSFGMLFFLPACAILLAQLRAGETLSVSLSLPLELFMHMRTISLSLFVASSINLDFYSTFGDVIPFGGMFLKIFGVQTLSLPDLLTQSIPGADQYPGVGIGASTLSVFFSVRNFSSAGIILLSLLLLRFVFQLVPRNVLYFFVFFQIPVLLRKGLFDIYFELFVFLFAFGIVSVTKKLRY